MPLNAIAQDYARGEITSAWVHDRVQGRHVLVYAVAELCPDDQPSSPRLGTAPHFQQQIRIEPNVRTLYIRRDQVTPVQAVAFFRGAAGSHVIPGGVPPITAAGQLATFSSDEEPILIHSNLTESTRFGAVLPRRPTALAVLSKYDTTEATRTWLTDRLLSRVVEHVRETLQIDLDRFQEQLGGLHLCFANPVLRRFERSVTADERTLLVRCFERAGCSVAGCELELSNEWPPVGNGFRLREIVTAPFFALTMPAQPHQLRVRLFDRNGRCIEDDSGVFLREVAIDLGIRSHRRITYTSPAGRRDSYDVEAVSYESPRRQATRPRSPLQHVDAALRARELDDLAASRVFLYFPGGDASRREALAIVRELAGGARDRCDVVDPYLSADDVAVLVPFVRDARCPVRLLSSRKFLQDRGEDGATFESRLAVRVEELRGQLPFPIAASQMGGRDRSPVHDRVLVVDENVYLLGSSLSEFGSRATTIFRVPDPRRLRAEVDAWWADAAPLDPSPRERTLRMEFERFTGQVRTAAQSARTVVTVATQQVLRNLAGRKKT